MGAAAEEELWEIARNCSTQLMKRRVSPNQLKLPTCDMQKCFSDVMYLCRPPAFFTPKWKWIWNTLINHSSVPMSTHILIRSEILFTILLSLHEIYQQSALKMWCLGEKNECIFILIFFVIWKVYTSCINPSTPFPFRALCCKKKEPVKVVPKERRQYTIVFYIFHSEYQQWVKLWGSIDIHKCHRGKRKEFVKTMENFVDSEIIFKYPFLDFILVNRLLLFICLTLKDMGECVCVYVDGGHREKNCWYFTNFLRFDFSSLHFLSFSRSHSIAPSRKTW